MRARLIGWIRSTPYLSGLPRDVAILSAVAFCVALGFGILTPALPVYARSFGVSAFAVSVVISSFAFMRFVSAPGAGSLVNRIGERKVLSTGIWIVAVSSLLSGLAQNYVQLLVLRAIGGIGSAMFTVSAMALLLRTVSSEQRGRAAGAFQAGFLFGGIAGPALGGAVTEISLRAPFFVYAATLAGAALVGGRYLHNPSAEVMAERAAPQGRDPEEASPETGWGLRHALGLSAYRAALAANLSNGFIAFGLRASLVPLYVVEGLGHSVGTVSLGFLVSAIAQAVSLIPAGRLADRKGRKPVMVFGGIAVAAGMAVLVVPTGLVGFFIAMGLTGVGGACLGSGPSAVVGDIAQDNGKANVVSVYQMTSDFGAILGPLVAGALKDTLGFNVAFGIGLAVAAGSLLLSMVMSETLKRTPAAPMAGSPE